MATTQITRYVIHYASKAFPPRIWFYDADDNNIGQAVFIPDSTPTLPNDNERSLYYRQSDYANVVDILRNEGPVYYAYVGDGASSENALRTAKELVGEGDG